MAKGKRSGGGYNQKGGTSSYYDRTDSFLQRGIDTLAKFEDYTREKKLEYAGVFDAEGKLIAASTSYSPHSTALPPQAAGAEIVSHNHPYNPKDEPDRMLGAAHSEQDVIAQISLGIKQMRASAGGHNEDVYIMRRLDRANVSGMMRFAERSRAGNTMVKRAFKKAETIKSNMRAAGYSEESIAATGKGIGYGLIQNAWKEAAPKYGFEFINVKRRHEW